MTAAKKKEPIPEPKDGYLHVVNWEKFQHYHDRTPPWIKLHRDLLRDYKFSCLQDASKLHLMLLWLLASQLDNNIPPDTEWIRKQMGLTEPVDLTPLIDKGFITSDSNTLATCKQSAIGEAEAEAYSKEAYSKESETQTTLCASAQKFPDRFEEWWSQYPKKVGKKSVKAIWKRRKLDEKADVIIADTIKRPTACRKWKDGFITNPSTYLNQDRWEDEYDISTNKSGKQPVDNSGLWEQMVAEGYAEDDNLRPDTIEGELA